MLNLLSLNSATKLHYLIWNNIQYRDIQNCLISTFQNFVLGIDAMLCWLGTSATLLRYKVKIPKVIISDIRCLKFNWRFVIFLWNMLIMSVIVVYVCQNCVSKFFFQNTLPASHRLQWRSHKFQVKVAVNSFLGIGL